MTQPNGISNSTNDSVFSAGSILSGLTIGTLHPGLQSNALEVYQGSIGNYWVGDTLVLSFAPGVSAVGEDVFANTSYGPSFAGNIMEEIFNGSTPLGAKDLHRGGGRFGLYWRLIDDPPDYERRAYLGLGRRCFDLRQQHRLRRASVRGARAVHFRAAGRRASFGPGRGGTRRETYFYRVNC